MESIQQIEDLLSEIQPAERLEQFWHIESIPSLNSQRVLLSRDSLGDYCVFLKGSFESFGRLPAVPNIEHNENAIDAITGIRFPALQIRSSRATHGNRAIAHIVYELTQALGDDPGVDNASLIQRVNWILELLGHSDQPMQETRQRGLVAECLLLGQLLQRGREYGIGPDAIIDRWHGPTGGRRDFAGAGVAIEVKSTAAATRRHRIDTLAQLETDASESLFIYSVGLRHDSSLSKCLADYIDEIFNQLVNENGIPLPDARVQFEDKVTSYGFRRSHESIYRSGAGILQNPNLPPRLFSVEELDRLRLSSFKTDELPRMVSNVSYDLELSGNPLSRQQTNDALDMMIVG